MNTVSNVSRFGISRKMVASQTSASWRHIPHVSYIFDIDLTELLPKIKALNEEIAKDGHHVTLNTVMIRAICMAISQGAPKLNSHLHFEQKLVRGKLTTYKDMDVNLPILTDSGRTVTANLHGLNNKTLGEINDCIADFQRRLKKTNLDEALYRVSYNDTLGFLKSGDIPKAVFRLIGSKTGKKHRVKQLKGAEKKAYDAIPSTEKLTDADVKQGTITISNIGSITRSVPGEVAMLMIVPPQVCAIGLGSATKKPVVETDENGEDKVVIKTMLPADIVFDHRVFDFEDIVPFLEKLKEIIANPDELLVY